MRGRLAEVNIHPENGNERLITAFAAPKAAHQGWLCVVGNGSRIRQEGIPFWTRTMIKRQIVNT